MASSSSYPPLWQALIDDGPSIYYDPNFMAVLEVHIPYLIANALSLPLRVEPEAANKYEYDLYGLLAFYHVPKQYHWLIMRMNNMTSPEDYRRTRLQLIFPDVEKVETIRDIEMTMLAIV